MAALNALSFCPEFSQHKRNRKFFHRTEMKEKCINAGIGAYHWATWSSWSYNLDEEKKQNRDVYKMLPFNI